MTGVVMLLDGPLQSWGGPAPGIYQRPTDSMPSLSGVIGIVANALGRKRLDGIGDLAIGAELAVRADRPGTLVTDFHTVGTAGRFALTADKGNQLKNPVVTHRQYLADAAFLAVYTPPPDGAAPEMVFDALLEPARPLYLGRRSCPPGERIAVVLTGDRSAREVLEQAALLRSPHGGTPRPTTDSGFYDRAGNEGQTIPVLVEMSAPSSADPLEVAARQDSPTTFDPRRLYHLDRKVTREQMYLPETACVGRGLAGAKALYESLGASP
ncbi:type I-E CRISPR-associated protein Cas5/CasD [Candidatus Poriferisocius sp.]|uniref:type I-E CRISPR-associated protein Cas5/CasD n=1 Tax=Candidatus Poriferisocius sp. TaxID=3101276 RepID=UPI003B01237D